MSSDTLEWILGIAIFGVVFLVIAKRGQHSKHRTIRWLFGGVVTRQKRLPENQYHGLRAQALSMRPDTLGLKGDLPSDHVYGIIMDWAFRDQVVTLVAFETGDSSMYLSSGGIHIGGVARPLIREAAERFVAQSNRFLPRAERTDFMGRVPADHVAFYLLTSAGRYRLLQPVPGHGGLDAPDASLFHSGQTLISRWRESES